LRVSDSEELGKVLPELLNSPERRDIMGTAGLRVVQDQKGATRRTMKALRERCIPGQEE
jgi:3-deoxy-D-manno-octulosonic-acid transferase